MDFPKPKAIQTQSISTLTQGAVDRPIGFWPSIAIDKQGIPHVSYCDAGVGDLVYATQNPNKTWRYQTVVSAGAVGKFTAIAINPQSPSQTPSIVFHNQDDQTLRYVSVQPQTQTHQKPKTERIAWGPDVGMAAELRFDPKGAAHVVYYSGAGALMHAWRSAKAPHHWQNRRIGQGPGGSSMHIGMLARQDGFWTSHASWPNVRDTILYAAKQPWPDSDVRNIQNTKSQPSIVSKSLGPGWISQLSQHDGRISVWYAQSIRPTLWRADLGADGSFTHHKIRKDVGKFALAQSPDGQGLALVYEDIYLKTTGAGTLRLLARVGKAPWQHHTLAKNARIGDIRVAMGPQYTSTVVYFDHEIYGLRVFQSPYTQQKARPKSAIRRKSYP